MLDATPEIKTFWIVGVFNSLTDDILYYRWISIVIAESLLLAAPRNIISKIFHELHATSTAGHLGRERTLKSIKRRVFWPRRSSDVKRWCKQCDIYPRAQRGPGLGRSPHQQSVTGAPLDRVGIDNDGPLPVTNDGNEYLIVLCDYFTKWTEAYPVPNHTALTVSDKVVNEFISKADSL